MVRRFSFFWALALTLGWGMLPGQLEAQSDFTWWENHVGWDGITPWTHYLRMAPAFMGPNALPVPFHQKGRVEEELLIENRVSWSGGFGDESLSLFSRVYWPVFPKWLGVEFYMVPVEVFRMDTLIRNQRNTRVEDPRGVAVGDLYINTHIQLLRDKRNWPDILLGLHLRTASGNRLDQARFTDGPGYWFDLSIGKTHALGKRKDWQLRWYAMGGFYVWQQYITELPQNDAGLFGAGMDLTYRGFSIEQDLSGYIGYLDEGDIPVVYRAALGYRVGQWQLRAHYGYGLRDYPYHTLQIGFTFYVKVKPLIPQSEKGE